MSPMLISTIIPTLNEDARVADTIARLRLQPGEWELIVVDGGSADATIDRAERAGADHVLSAPRGRGTQMNAGAAMARGEVLLFLHADVHLPSNAHRTIQDTLAARKGSIPPIAGCFVTRTVPDGPCSALARTSFRLADFRSRFTRLPYGDQGLFLRRESFRAAGGFADLPLMEDIELSRRLARMGEIRRTNASVRVSARRFQAAPIRALLAMRTFPLAFRLGVPAELLHRLYGQAR